MANDVDNELVHYLLSNSYKRHKQRQKDGYYEVDDLTEVQALEVCNEILDIFIKHNLSLKNSFRIAQAITYGLAEGTLDLYNNEL